ncbi:MAG: hypothetical protein J5779_03065 [Clostridia bacterium]|nr:hypothetical protein [Clostridia bacterium]
MYTYKFSGDVDLDSASQKEGVITELKKIDEKYSFKSSDVEKPEIEKKEFTAPTNEEILEKAENNLQDYKKSNLEKIENNFSNKFAGIEDEALEVLSKKEEKQNDLEEKYEGYAQKAINSSIKKGLADSSIFDEVLKQIEDNKHAEISKANSEFQKKLDKLESEKSILQSQKDSALSSFDISYALKLENEINSINSAIAKEQNEVLKYNQKLEKEAEAELAKRQKEIANQNKQLQDLISKNGQTEVNKMKYKEKFDVVESYLNSLSKSEALRELEDPFYENELGTYYTYMVAKTHGRD